MAELKTHWKEETNPDFLGAYSLQPGEERTLKIINVKSQMVTLQGGSQELKTVATFENSKPMILNPTNCKIITSLYKTPYLEDWSGKMITVFATKKEANGKAIKFGGEIIEALRIKYKIPVINKPELTPDHKRWNPAKKALAEKTITLEKLQETYFINPKNLKLICSK